MLDKARALEQERRDIFDLYKDQPEILNAPEMTDVRLQLMAEARKLREQAKGSVKPVMQLDEFLDHPELFATYPFLKEVKVVRPVTSNSAKLGYFDPNKNEIGLYKHKDKSTGKVSEGDGLELLKTVLHEVQHKIQHYEGFDTGTNTTGKSYTVYRHKGGEIEAVNTGSSRVKMTPDERAETPSWETDITPPDGHKVNPDKIWFGKPKNKKENSVNTQVKELEKQGLKYGEDFI
jgi:hypothetical protein